MRHTIKENQLQAGSELTASRRVTNQNTSRLSTVTTAATKQSSFQNDHLDYIIIFNLQFDF